MPNKSIDSRIQELEAIVYKLVIASRAHQSAIEGLIAVAEGDQQQQQPAPRAPLSTLN
jgi:hypothetical protein